MSLTNQTDKMLPFDKKMQRETMEMIAKLMRETVRDIVIERFLKD